MGAAPTTADALFREQQRPRQPWILALVGFIALLSVTAFVWQIALGRPWGTNPAPDAVVWIVFVLFGLGLPAFFLFTCLTTEVRPDALVLVYRPLRRRSIPLADVRRAEAVTYRPLLDYGGWGLRWWPGSGWAWSVSGNRGVRLELADGKRLLVGSLRADELQDALRRAGVATG
jgi:hypothetical protein